MSGSFGLSQEFVAGASSASLGKPLAAAFA